GKDGNLYVVNRDNMGKFNSSKNNIYQEMDGVLPGGVFAMPAYFNGTVFYGPVANTIRGFQVTNALLPTAPSSQTKWPYGYPGTTPGISANGTSNAILWAIEAGDVGAGVLHAVDATNLQNEIYNSDQNQNGRDHFRDNKFVTPTVANGKVYIGTPTGVTVFGMLQ